MSYTIASIKRVKIDKNRKISLFLEPAVNFKTIMEQEIHLLIIEHDDKRDAESLATKDKIVAAQSINTEFELPMCYRSIINLLPFWIDKRTLLKIEFNKYNSKLIESIEMYDEDNR